MGGDHLHVVEWHNGDKLWSPFSDAEMKRRQAGLRAWMAINEIDTALLTSHHAINYYSGWLYCAFGRTYGMVIDHGQATTISAALDGGHPWRRSHGGNVSYTDRRRDNFFSVARQLTQGARRIAIEFDHVTLDLRRLLEEALPGVTFVDVGEAAMWMRTIKSDEEIALIRTGGAIAVDAAQAAQASIRPGLAEHDIATLMTRTMTERIADAFPYVELMDSWSWFRSGINTDGAHNPVSNRKIARGDILGLAAFPMLFGYCAPLGRTLFCGDVDGHSRTIWTTVNTIHRQAIELVRPGTRCSDIARQLNAMLAEADLAERRVLGHGRSLGIVGPHFGREGEVDLSEDNDTELAPGMVVSVDLMVTLPDGHPGAGGYCERDTVIVGAEGSELATPFAAGPAHLLVSN